MKLQDWLNKSFGITSVNKDEVQFPCPKCKSAAFYFNLIKRVGYCHRAACRLKVGIKELTKYSKLYKDPSNLSYEPVSQIKVIHEVKLPAEAKPLVELIDGQLVTFYDELVKAVIDRGVTAEDQSRFNFHFDGNRIYIPVYNEGKLVNYVGRAYPWKRTDILRYSYCPGASTKDFIFNWDTIKLCNYVVLVENTFNGIWLNRYCHATSNFGSHLSKNQIDMMSKSKIKDVVLLWDQGADKMAGKARDQLMAVGIQATVLKINGQPDNYTIEELKPWIDYALHYSKEKAIIDSTALLG